MLINICQEYAQEKYLTYSKKKTKTMMISSKQKHNVEGPNVYLDNAQVSRVTQQSYLGVCIRDDLSDVDSVDKVKRGLYARGNAIKRKFSNCNEEVKLELFRSHCSNFYCCSLWSLEDTETLLKSAKVCHNNILRYFIRTKRGDSISRLFMFKQLCNFDVIHRKAIVSLYTRSLLSKNGLISTLFESVYFLHSDFSETGLTCFMLFRYISLRDVCTIYVT